MIKGPLGLDPARGPRVPSLEGGGVTSLWRALGVQDVVGPGCVMEYDYPQYFFLILIVLAAGLLFYLVRWVVQVLTRAWKLRRIDAAIEKVAAGKGEYAVGEGADDLAIQELQTEVEHRNRMNDIVYGTMSWLDACYIGVAIRVLPVFVPQQVR